MDKFTYNKEDFSQQEQSILLKYFTNIDKPVFGLINMPDVVKGALFARYSRSNKSLRRLFLDEFYEEDEFNIDKIQNAVGIDRATELYDKMILDFGDDSVAQLGGAHIACEQVSNILAKVIERGRIASYLEQSTRYVYYNKKVNGKYNYYIPTEIRDSKYLSEYEKFINNLFDAYSEIIEELSFLLKEKHPKGEDQTERAWKTTLKAKACDITRGLLPASTRTNLGIFASGQSYEYMLVKMFASNNEEVQQYAKMILEELRKVIPSFLKRVDLKDRGKLWSEYISNIETEMNDISLYDQDLEIIKENMHIDLVHWDDNAVDKIVSSALYEYSNLSNSNLNDYTKKLSTEEKLKIVKAYFGERKNRRQRPSRALETIDYQFDIISDYGAFRDLQRHRILTLLWQKISPKHGYVIPDELNEYPKLKEKFIKALELAAPLYNKLQKELGVEISQYVMPFAYKMRYLIKMNLREAFHLLELRTQKQGHISYRKVCLKMLELIEKKAGHKVLTDHMNFIDSSFHELSRMDAEKRKDIKIKKVE